MINIKNEYITPTTCNKKVIKIGTLGRFVKKKGFDCFIEAIKIVHKTHPNINVSIAGNGEEYDNLTALSKALKLDNIIKFEGWITDKNDFFNNIDIFCLPSLHEPFGIVLIEAYAASKPVVTSNAEGPAEIATNMQNAIIVEKNNPEEMANALITLIDEPELAERIAYNGYKKAKAKYDIPIISNKIQKSLQQIIKNYHD